QDTDQYSIKQCSRIFIKPFYSHSGLKVAPGTSPPPTAMAAKAALRQQAARGMGVGQGNGQGIGSICLWRPIQPQGRDHHMLHLGLVRPATAGHRLLDLARPVLMYR